MKKIGTTGGSSFTVPNDPVIRDLIPGYLANRRKDVQRLGELAAVADYKGLLKIGHDMRGSGTAYGIEPISQLGAAIEDAARNENLEAVRRLTVRLDSFLTTIKFKS